MINKHERGKSFTGGFFPPNILKVERGGKKAKALHSVKTTETLKTMCTRTQHSITGEKLVRCSCRVTNCVSAKPRVFKLLETSHPRTIAANSIKTNCFARLAYPIHSAFVFKYSGSPCNDGIPIFPP